MKGNKKCQTKLAILALCPKIRALLATSKIQACIHKTNHLQTKVSFIVFIFLLVSSSGSYGAYGIAKQNKSSTNSSITPSGSRLQNSRGLQEETK